MGWAKDFLAHAPQVLLYDWWPIPSEARLFDRLSAMPVRILYVAPSHWAR